MDAKKHDASHDANLKGFANEVDSIQSLLDVMATDGEVKELLRIMKKPGFTTPQELALCLGWAENTHAQLAQIKKSIGAFVKTADTIGE